MSVSDNGPFGTTVIPTGSYSISFDDQKLQSSQFDGIAQQPQTQPIAVYEASKNDTLDPLVRLNSNLIDVNPQFVVYTVKNGLIRVMHRHSSERGLLRGHQNQVVTDINFFHDGDVLGTVGYSEKQQSSTLIVWRVYQRSPGIFSERLLEISTDSSNACILSRLVWHPFNPNQFWMTHSTKSNKQVATLVETTRIQTKLVATPKDPKAKSSDAAQQQQQHALCQWHSPQCVMDQAIQLRASGNCVNDDDAQLVDLCWSGRDARHVLSVHKNGGIFLWDLKGKEADDGTGPPGGDGDEIKCAEDASVVPRKLFSLIESGVEHSRCLFLPHEQSMEYNNKNTNHTKNSLTTCFATASNRNATVTIWSSFLEPSANSSSKPVLPIKLQEVSFSSPSPSSFVLDVCYGPADLNGKPPSSFLVLGSRDTGRLYALHVKAEWSEGDTAKAPLCVGIDYLVPFALKHPVYSWSVVCGPTELGLDDDEGASGSGFDMKAFAYQSKAVQCLTMTSSMSLPPTSSESCSNNGIYQVKPLEGPYSGAIADNVESEQKDDYEYEEEDYDIEDIDHDEPEEEEDPVQAVTPAAAPAVPAPAGGLFPGAPNPFANWLGAIAGGTADAPTTTESKDDDEEEEDLPTPPAPSDLPMPPGIIAQVPATGTGDTNAIEDGLTVEEFLNPLELLESIGAGKETSAPALVVDESNGDTNDHQKPSRKAPSSSNNKNKSPSQPQSSKKGGKTKTPFPDGKVTILKRDPESAIVPSVSLPGKDTLSPPPPVDPAVLADPGLLTASVAPVSAASPAEVSSPTIDPEVLRDQIDKAVSKAVDRSVGKAVGKAVDKAVDKAIEKAMDKVVSGLVVPAVDKTVQQSFAGMARPLHKSMESLSNKGVSVDADALREAIDVELPLKVAFAEGLKTVLVPALEGVAGQMFKQVQENMPKPPPAPDHSAAFAALAQQLTVMTSKMDDLTTEVMGLRKTVTTLRKTVSDQAVAAAKAVGASAPKQNSGQNAQPAQPDPRHEIDQLLARGQYDLAFKKAVSTPTPQMAVYCCARSNIEKVLSGPSPALSQPILICLMQQLSAAMAGKQSPQELNIEVAWLQEIALCMNPKDSSIAQHVPNVVGKLVTTVNARMEMEGNASPFRRPLQMLLQILLGMQHAPK